MPKAASGRRYAQAVFQIAMERGELDSWLDDLILLVRALENSEFSDLLDAPQISASRKREIIRDTLGQTVGPLASNLVSLLASRNIASTIPSVVSHYERLLDASRGVEQAEVISAVPLDDRQLGQVVELLKVMASKEIKLTARTESEIIGGIITKIGDRVIDGSVRTRLESMRRALVER